MLKHPNNVVAIAKVNCDAPKAIPMHIDNNKQAKL